MYPTLCLEVREATMNLHVSAENSFMMKKYIHRTVSLQDHLYILVQQQMIHDALQTSLDISSDQSDFSQFLSNLYRSGAIRHDIAFICEKLGVDQQGLQKQILQETKNYQQYLANISNDSEKLYAHAYVQYRALFNGGYILNKTIKKLLEAANIAQLEENDGLTYFHFMQAGHTLDKQFVEYINAIDNIDKNKFIEEVKRAYEFITDIYNINPDESRFEKYARNASAFWHKNKEVIVPAAIGTVLVTRYILT